MPENNPPLLELDGVHKYFPHDTGLIDTILGRKASYVQAVDDVSFTLDYEDSLGIIGESGCGKTTLVLTLLQLYKPTEGTIYYEGQDVSAFNRKQRKQFRRDVQIIFQDPFNSLNPKRTVRGTLMEPLRIHGMDNKDERIHRILEQVELDPDSHMDRYPNQLSGGEKQRVSIARALILEPNIILADEPASMLDVSTQASILNLLSGLVEDLGVSMIYISHDLSTISYVCQDVSVMYLGRMVEVGKVRDVLKDPKHPYTQELIASIPIPNPEHKRKRTQLKGVPEPPINLGEGCRFRDRCPERMDICEKTPHDVSIDDGDRRVACHLYYDHKADEATADSASVHIEGD